MESVRASILANAYSSGPGKDLTGNKKSGEMLDNVSEGGCSPHEVILVATIRRALVVGVVLVEPDREWASRGGCLGGSTHDFLARPVPQHRIEGVGHFGAGIFRMRMINVKARSVGEYEVGQAEVFVGQLGWIRLCPAHVVAASITQGGFLLKVPAW